jgi:hypothetical protein
MTPLSSLLCVLVMLASSPSPSPTSTLSPSDVSPGLAGFVATFAVVAMTVLLILDMARRIRRIRYREEVRARRESGAPPE